MQVYTFFYKFKEVKIIFILKIKAIRLLTN